MDNTPKSIAVICAMDFELAHLQRLLAGVDWPVELVLSGFGMVAAETATREAIARARPELVLNYGCAGAHRPELAIGDIVVGTRAVAYAQDAAPVVECDATLLAIAREVAVRFERVAFGAVASADAWNRTAESIGALAIRHDSMCEDMEAAAIGLVCAERAVPFLTVKDISNNELVQPTIGGGAALRTLGLDQVARRAAEFTFAVLGQIVSSHPAPGLVRHLDPA